MAVSLVDSIVIPGEVVIDCDLEKASVSNKFILGPGLRRSGDDVVVSRAGLLRKKAQQFWVESPQRRYLPVKGEKVVGVVVKKIGDYFKIDICSTEQALLYFLSFENASKKNRPNLNTGDVIYGKLVSACPDMEPELVCCDSAGRNDGLGYLGSEGMLFSCSLHLCRTLLHPRCRLVQLLGNLVKFENCIGMNGKIWLRTPSVETTLRVADALLSAENVPLDEMDQYCRRLVPKFKRK